MSDKPLGPQSPIVDVFDRILPETGVTCIPTKVPAPEGKAYLAIMIAGNADEAQLLLANLMSYVEEMHAVAEQKRADTIVGSDGTELTDEPAIIVP